MLSLILCFAGLVTLPLALSMMQVMRSRAMVRSNWRGRKVIFPGGLVIAVVSGFLLIGVLLASIVHGRDPIISVHYLPYLIAVFGAGLVDDLIDHHPRGLRGHLDSLRSRRISTGILKALITTIAAAISVWTDPNAGLIGFGLLVLGPHIFNLLDLRPGRTVKVWSAALIILGLTAGLPTLVAPFIVTALIVGWNDLRERAMLGDCGSNLLGALFALIMLRPGVGVQFGVLVLLAAVTIFGEFVSISKTIDRNPLLRTLDRLGRPGGRHELAPDGH